MYTGKSIFGSLQDQHFMQLALEQAKKAQAQGEVPIGAVIVNKDGQVVARAFNSVEKNCSQQGHAELLVLAKAGKKCQNWRLDGHWLYVTLQPCIMCMGLIRLSRLDGVVFGATSPIFGFDVDFALSPRVYKSEIALIGGVLQEEAGVLLREFFQNKRKEKR